MYKYGKRAICSTQADIERGGGTIVKNTDGTVDVFYRGINSTQINNKACCEILGFKFNIDKQRCYWSDVPAAKPCDDCTTKVVYNPKDSDGVVFNVRESETCSLDLSLDYILNFDCDLFSKVCSGNETDTLIKDYTTTITSLKTQINYKKTECEALTKRIENLTTIFNGLCYVIKGTKTTTTTGRGGFNPEDIYGLGGRGAYVPENNYGLGTTTTTTGGGTTTTGGGTTTTGGDTTTGRDAVVPVIYNDITNTWVDTTSTPNDVVGGRTPVKPYYVKDTTKTTTTTTTNTGGRGTNLYDTTINNLDNIPTYFNADGVVTNSDGVVNSGIRNPSSDYTNNILPITPKYNNLSFRNETIGGVPNTTSGFIPTKTPPPPFAWQWRSAYIKQTTTNTTTSGPVSYCLTEKGLVLWATILGEIKYATFTNSFGCDENSYTQTNFNDLIAKVDIEVNKDTSLKVTDFITETTQGPCDKKIANDNLAEGKASSQNCSKQLAELNNQVTTTTALLNEATAASTSSSNSPISNLESLQVHLNLEVETSPNIYESVYEEPIFNIGQGNLLNYILNESPDTGILISGTTSGGIFKSPYAFDLEDYATTYREPTPATCETGRAQFMKDLYLQQYKGVFPDPTTPDEELALNKTMNGWYNSSWLYYNRTLDEAVTAKILNKKIKVSLRIENCCLDLCILTDNLNLTKRCESLDNQEIIISESPKFEIERVMDNRKSWVSYTENTGREHDLQFRETQYDIDDYRLSINTKEIDLKIDGANAIEEDVLCIIDCLISGDTSYSNTGTTITSTTVTTTTGECQITNSFGYLYNWYTVVDVKNIANPNGGNGQTNSWRAPSRTDFTVLADYIVNNVTGYFSSNRYYGVNDALKTTGTTVANTGCWAAGSGTNILNFDSVPSGIRNNTGPFITAGSVASYWTTTTHPSPGYSYYVDFTSFLTYISVDISTLQTMGLSIRLVRNATTSEQLLTNGTNSVDNPTQLDPYIGNDGKIYKTTKIGTQIWLSQDLLETKFNDSSNIPEVVSNGSWSVLTTSARSTYIGYNASLINCTGTTTDCVEIQVTSTTVTTVANTCCVEKCDYGLVSEIGNVQKSLNNGKYSDTGRNHPAYHVGYHVQTPSFKSLDTYTPSTADWGSYEYQQNDINQGIWKPIYPKVNVHVWWDNSLIDEIVGAQTTCDAQDYAGTNRERRNATIKAKNQLLLATSPYDWAQFEVPNFQIEKYYLNRPCSASTFSIGDAGPGGYVAYVDGTGQHGLVVKIASVTRYWHATDSGLVSATNDGIYSGQTNTSLIVSTYGSEANVAKYANDYTSTGNDGTIYSDYYLPSKYELNLISQNWREIGIRLFGTESYMWSSTENNASTAWAQDIYTGTQAIYNKSTPLGTIVVRKF